MKKQTYYELLKVERKSNIAEIVAAYHSAKGAFSKDSLATYSLFSAEEIQIELNRLEEAYLTLSNVEKKREYDRLLNLKGDITEHTLSMTEQTPAIVAQPPEETSPTLPLPVPNEVSGKYLKQVRTQKGLSLDDVSRITKIPLKFLKSIEEEDIARLPARVYVQGFIKNMAALYKLDGPTIASAYLTSLDQRTKEIWKE